ncbi:hypothetical protein ACFWZU_15935 [Frateuria sp. GZRR33]|uniref:hypothetical protein n=1 Tax=Frateuria sp. GZRR33 TaxID=3351535 RepID=UPI003EDBDAA9
MNPLPGSDRERTEPARGSQTPPNGVFATPPHPIGWFVRLLVVVGGLFAAFPIVVSAMLATAFAGTPYGVPPYYLVYLGATQALPLAVAAIAWAVFLITLRKSCLKILGIATAVYVASWMGLFLILPGG